LKKIKSNTHTIPAIMIHSVIKLRSITSLIVSSISSPLSSWGLSSESSPGLSGGSSLGGSSGGSCVERNSVLYSDKVNYSFTRS